MFTFRLMQCFDVSVTTRLRARHRLEGDSFALLAHCFGTLVRRVFFCDRVITIEPVSYAHTVTRSTCSNESVIISIVSKNI